MKRIASIKIYIMSTLNTKILDLSPAIYLAIMTAVFVIAL